MEKRELLYEGKAKRVYRTDDPESLIVSYKDDATAFNGLKKGRIAGKGTHRELLETCPTYREIAQSQLSKEELE